MSSASGLATAVRTAISAGSPTGTPTITLAFLPIFEMDGANAAGTKIQVYCASVSWDVQNRCVTTTKDYVIGVAFSKYIAPASGAVGNSGVTTMLDLVEQVADIVAAAGKLDGCRLMSMEQPQLFDLQRLHDSGIYETVLTLTYKGP